MNRFPVYIKNERYGVAMRFRSVGDRDRYLNDPYTSSGFVACEEQDAERFLADGGYVWQMPSTFYEGTLNGLEVMFSCPKVFAGVYD